MDAKGLNIFIGGRIRAARNSVAVIVLLLICLTLPGQAVAAESCRTLAYIMKNRDLFIREARQENAGASFSEIEKGVDVAFEEQLKACHTNSWRKNNHTCDGITRTGEDWENAARGIFSDRAQFVENVTAKGIAASKLPSIEKTIINCVTSDAAAATESGMPKAKNNVPSVSTWTREQHCQSMRGNFDRKRLVLEIYKENNLSPHEALDIAVEVFGRARDGCMNAKYLAATHTCRGKTFTGKEWREAANNVFNDRPGMIRYLKNQGLSDAKVTQALEDIKYCIGREGQAADNKSTSEKQWLTATHTCGGMTKTGAELREQAQWVESNYDHFISELIKKGSTLETAKKVARLYELCGKMESSQTAP